MFNCRRPRSTRSAVIPAASRLAICVTVVVASLVGLPPEPTVAATTSSKARIWLTTPDRSKLLQRQSDVAMVEAASTDGTLIVVDDRVQGQRYRGVGASLTESSAVTLDRLPARMRDAAMTALFSPSRGIGINWLRQPVGASDFALSDYTLADERGTPLSLARDEEHVLPALRRAAAVNPELGVMLTPWSAPAWMKTARSTHGGTLDPTQHAAYAQYLAESVSAYQSAGVPVEALTIANEPLHSTSKYPSMYVPVDTARKVISFLPGAMSEAGVTVKVYGYDHNWDNTDYPLGLLGDASTRAALAGTAFHCYAGDVSSQAVVHRAHPDKEIIMSECSGGDWSTDFGSNLRWNAHNLLVGAFRNGASALSLWNVALDTGHGPTNGGCSNCRGVLTVDLASRTWSRNVEYYVLGHIGKFVRPGARRVASTSQGAGGVESVAFRNPDGSHALIIHNNGMTTRKVSVQSGTRSAPLTLSAGALATMTW